MLHSLEADESKTFTHAIRVQRICSIYSIEKVDERYLNFKLDLFTFMRYSAHILPNLRHSCKIYSVGVCTDTC